VPKYVLFWVVFRVLGRLPVPALYVIADITAALAYRLATSARGNVLDNLRHVTPDASETKIRKAARQVFRNVAYYYADFAHLPHIDVQQFYDERLTIHGVHEQLLPLLREGKGAIMLSGHLGNPELVLQGLAALGQTALAVTEPVEPPALARMLNGIRSSHGHEFHPVGVKGVKRIIQGLRSGKTAALMGDRDIEGPRMRLPFFGHETWMPTGPIELGLREGVPIFPSFSYRRGRFNLEAWLEPPIGITRTDDFQADVRATALEFIARLEARLRAEPWQWLVLERIWDDDVAQAEPAVKNAKKAAA
jgi:lauroyl/myristoyl acyltransferase